MIKNLPANAGDTGWIPELGRFPEEGNGNTFQYSCLGNPIDRGAWKITVHRVARIRLGLVTKQQLKKKKFFTPASGLRFERAIFVLFLASSWSPWYVFLSKK